MDFRILGPLEVRADDRPLSLGGTRQRAVLAILLLHANEVVPADRLIDQVWGERPPATAAHTLQVYVSNLRKLLGTEAARLVTRTPGYLLSVEPDELDLERFERLADESRRALADGRAEVAAEMLREALALWRGDALADFAYEAFAGPAASRLEELRLAAVEERIEADLRSGRHAELAGELETLVAAHPLRERLRAQLMLTLYRSGRQAEALEVFQETRHVLVEELGIDPTPALQRLERAILQQDPGLEPPARAREAPARSILLAAHDDETLGLLVALAEPLARGQTPHELLLVRLTPPADAAALAEATRLLAGRRAALAGRGLAVRTAAFSSGDLVRFVSRQEVDLLLVAGQEDSAAVLADAPCDVALATGGAPRAGPVLVPFGGSEHDWAALELGAWLAGALGVGLKLLGALDEESGRDASRLLAHASLAVQGVAGIAAEPLLAEAGPESVAAAAGHVGTVVVGLADAWREGGIGAAREELARRTAAPTLLVRRGLRPGGLAPDESLTRFTWSLAPST